MVWVPAGLSLAASQDTASSQQVVIVAQADASDTPATRDAETPSRHWMIFADEFGVGDALDTLLDARGESCEIIRRSETANWNASEFLR